MSVRIGSNISSLQAQRRLGEATEVLGKTYEKLSSGQRINRASDDAAGLAIAKTLDAKARIFTQGIRNLNDGLSYTAIAGGAVKELKSILYRQRELSTQSSNGTYTDRQREAMEVELKELSAEWNRVLDSATFNGRKVFSAKEGSLTLQAGIGNDAVLHAAFGSSDSTAQDDLTWASTPAGNIEGLAYYAPAISDDGRYVAFSTVLFARQLVADIGAYSLEQFYKAKNSRQKKDTTIVTDTDIAVEEMVKKAVTERFPDHDVLGEEGGSIRPGAEFRWIVDPVDGTQSFVHGIPTFGNMMALFHHDTPLLGIIAHPALNLTYWAAKDMGCFCNNDRITIVDSPNALDVNEILCTCLKAQYESTGHGNLFDRLIASHPYVRIYYDCFGLTRAIHGQIGAMIEANVSIWDLAPCKIMAEEAGGKYVPLELGKNGKVSAIFGKPSVVAWVEKLFAK